MKPLTILVVAAGLVAPGGAAARDFQVVSFDGTPIQAHFFPAATLLEGRPAPTVLVGPGWGNGGVTNENAPTSESDGRVGVGPLRRAGYNVLTWDPRGFGESGGEAKWDSARYEARDVQALLDALALLPEAVLDSPGDPRVGMAGASYGGGAQYVTAAIDSRLDALAPSISWHSLVSSLYKEGAFKAGWAGVLCGTGTALGVSTGLVNSEGAQAGSMDRHFYSICQTGLATGRLFGEDVDWLADRGPAERWTGQVRTPTLIVHGTYDTLFSLDEAASNYRVLRRNGVPVRMMWFCGGHGSCQTSDGIDRYVETAVLRWFGRYLKGERLFDTGPAFEWIDQFGAWHPQSDYPLAPAGELSAKGSGALTLTAGDSGSSGTAVGGTPAVNGVEIEIPPPGRGSALVGAPQLELRYRGTGTLESTHVYAQVVDRDRDIVLGGQVTPLRVALDGAEHTLSRNLEPLAHLAGPSSDLALQLIPATGVYTQQRASGSLALEEISIRLPLGRDPEPADGGPPEEPPDDPPAPNCEPAFRPLSVERRQGGRVRLRPRIRCGGERLDLALTIKGGRHEWKGRTGDRARIPVSQRRQRLRALFELGGRRWKVRISVRDAG